MANIDTSKIEGYEQMTAEEKIAALESYALPDPDYTGYVKKDVFDKTSKELAALKKQHQDALSEDERKRLERDAEFQQMSEELETLRKEKTVSAYKAKYLAMGYDEALAEDTANAMADGDTDKVFANQQKFIESHDKAMKVERLKNISRLPVGSTETAMTKEEIMKIKDSTERQAAISENLPLFTEGA